MKWDLIYDEDSTSFKLEMAQSDEMPENSIKRLKLGDMRKFGSCLETKSNSPWWTAHSYMCPVCDRWLDGMCLKHPLIFIKENIPPMMPYTVFDTFPSFFYLADSTIKKAGKGVFTKVDLPSCLAFGPYTIFTFDDMSRHIWVDAVDFKYSNWMRYANMARFFQEQNMVGFQYDQYMYYYTFRPIKAHSEIMVSATPYRDENL
uniref:SET domain-containing protein n=1 Tax=Romanomermis culicivorax TaxID=13658 RepID=A0A915HUZ9_ROMCU